MAIEAPQSRLDPKTLDAVAEKAFHIARIAEAVALRNVKKIQTLFLIGILVAVWLTYYIARSFELTPVSALWILVVFALPPLVLGKLYGMLRKTIGLPQRLLQAMEKLKGRTAEFEQRLKSRASPQPTDQKAKLSELWRLGKVLLEVRSLGGEAREIASVLGEALILANPVFMVVLVISAAVTLSLLIVAIATAFLHAF